MEDYLTNEIILGKIYLIRDQKVMLDRDLAELFDIKAIRLREKVKRNMNRFPGNFMFQLSNEEANYLVSQNAIPSIKHLGGSLPYVFTEHGVLMLANVIRSQRAILLSIRIIEIFVKVREIVMSNKVFYNKLERIESKIVDHDKKLVLVFKYLKQLEQTKEEEKKLRDRKRIGYKEK